MCVVAVHGQKFSKVSSTVIWHCKLSSELIFWQLCACVRAHLLYLWRIFFPNPPQQLRPKTSRSDWHTFIRVSPLYLWLTSPPPLVRITQNNYVPRLQEATFIYPSDFVAVPATHFFPFPRLIFRNHAMQSNYVPRLAEQLCMYLSHLAVAHFFPFPPPFFP